MKKFKFRKYSDSKEQDLRNKEAMGMAFFLEQMSKEDKSGDDMYAHEMSMHFDLESISDMAIAGIISPTSARKIYEYAKSVNKG